MRDIFPVKFYSDEGFVEYKLEINDRFWIGDQTRGIVIGTSLTGLGNRYALMDYISDQDSADIYARYQALP